MSRSKRAFDLFFSIIGLVLAAPLLAVTALAVLLADGTPVLFKQERIGKHGQKFLLYKFRTMCTHTKGPLVTGDDDPRITKLGRFLRKSKLDELPQLINVALGEMSFVGPRPDVERYLGQMNEAQREVLKFTPGITSPATIAFRNEEAMLSGVEDREQFYIDHIMPRKAQINLEYSKKASLISDLKVMIQTLVAVLRPGTHPMAAVEEERYDQNAA